MITIIPSRKIAEYSQFYYLIWLFSTHSLPKIVHERVKKTRDLPIKRIIFREHMFINILKAGSSSKQ